MAVPRVLPLVRVHLTRFDKMLVDHFVRENIARDPELEFIKQGTACPCRRLE